MYKICLGLANNLQLEQPKLPRQGRTSSRLKDFGHSVTDSTKFLTIEDKYKTLYLKIIQVNIEEINNRFQDDSIATILSIAILIKFGKTEELENLRNFKFYNNLIDF